MMAKRKSTSPTPAATSETLASSPSQSSPMSSGHSPEGTVERRDPPWRAATPANPPLPHLGRLLISLALLALWIAFLVWQWLSG